MHGLPSAIALATSNPGKIEEIRALLSSLSIELRTAADYPEGLAVAEVASSLEGNAELKARAWHLFTGLPALADDTGLEVEALGGAPGVYSARFAGDECDASANCAKLLKKLEGVSHRRARFRTAVAFIDQHAEVHLFEGVCEGRILEAPRGKGGFGYDPLFAPVGEERTFAELSVEEKGRISHRGEALRAFVNYLTTSYVQLS